ncbi:MAG: redox-sensing transcriptional repressor Rex, partial [Thermaerobacterales bacterium]
MSRIPQVAVRRLPIYLRVLEELAEQEIEIASSAELARRSGFSSEQIRKDLAYFGAFGRRGVGYGTRTLSRQLRGILGLDPDVRAVLIGAGNLGTALARYNLVRHRDVRILHIFDNDQLKVGTMIESVRVRHVAEAESVVQAEDIRLAILAVPALAA